VNENLLAGDFDLSTLVEVRHQVEQRAQASGVTDLALYRFVVAVNEILTNAVRHGGGSGTLRLWRDDGRLHCRISDHGTGLNPYRPVRRPHERDTSGRGLWLARQNVDRFSIDARPSGTTVTLSIPTQ
jgi:anti-sigma regulatory factor (Ser/Thr protein kinase)